MKFILLITLFTTFLFPTEIKIVNYNVENLFDLKYSKKEYPKYHPAIDGWNSTVFNAKINNISSVIASIDPNIIVLEEIENRNVAKFLMKACNKKSTKFKYIAFSDDSTRSAIGTAILSDYKLENIETIRVKVSSRSYSRNLLIADAITPIGKIKIVAVHLPSKRAKEDHRVLAAKVVKSVIDTISIPYIIIGDFNESFDEACKLESENMNNSNGVTGINHILKTAHSKPNHKLKLNTINDVIQNRSLLYDPWIEVEDSVRFSYRYQGEYSTLDHILLSQKLLNNSGINYKYGSFKHITLGGALLKDGTPYRFESVKKDGKYHFTGKGFSDHLPISIVLTGKKEVYPIQTMSDASFESNHNGWIVKSPHFTAFLSSNEVVDGKKSLHITGKGKRNGTILQKSFIKTNNNAKVFYIGGEGTISIRIRSNKDEWKYLVGNKLSKSGQKSYFLLDKNRWEKIVIPLSNFTNNSKITIQIRYKGQVTQDFYIDKESSN